MTENSPESLCSRDCAARRAWQAAFDEAFGESPEVQVWLKDLGLQAAPERCVNEVLRQQGKPVVGYDCSALAAGRLMLFSASCYPEESFLSDVRGFNAALPPVQQ